MGQIKVLIGKNVVYATQYKSIIFKRSFLNYEEFQDVKIQAQSCAFAYAIYEVSAVCSIVTDENLFSTDEAVFAYLEKCHGIK